MTTKEAYEWLLKNSAGLYRSGAYEVKYPPAEDEGDNEYYNRILGIQQDQRNNPPQSDGVNTALRLREENERREQLRQTLQEESRRYWQRQNQAAARQRTLADQPQPAPPPPVTREENYGRAIII